MILTLCKKILRSQFLEYSYEHVRMYHHIYLFFDYCIFVDLECAALFLGMLVFLTECSGHGIF